ncbi:MAG: hypothetical protein RL026_757 [Pseudomonadota bacterium]|jgi:flagellar FliJ protein
MTRAERMVPVQRVMQDTERSHAGRLAAARQRVAEGESRLAQLRGYLAEYVNGLSERSRRGLAGTMLRDYQVFLTRLQSAVAQQAGVVAGLQAELGAVTREWQQAAQRAKALDTVVERWRVEERRVVERREQHDTDERALRATRTRHDG